MLADAFWNLVAILLASCSPLTSLLLAYAKRRPYFLLPGYMERFWLLGGSARDARTVEDRGWKGGALDAWIGRLVGARFHLILREDQDRHPHDHPWAFRSLILRGAYTESYHPVVKGKPAAKPIYRTHFSGSTYRLEQGAFHRITAVTGPVLTLCILGRPTRRADGEDDWGFLVDGERIGFKEYLGLGGK